MAAAVAGAVLLMSACTSKHESAPSAAAAAPRDGWKVLQVLGKYAPPESPSDLYGKSDATQVLLGTVQHVRPGRKFTYDEGRGGLLYTAFLEVKLTRVKSKGAEATAEDRLATIEVTAPPQIATLPDDFKKSQFGNEPLLFVVTQDVSTRATTVEFLEPKAAPEQWVRVLHPMGVIRREPGTKVLQAVMTEGSLPISGETIEDAQDEIAAG